MNENQKKTTDQYRQNWDEIFNQKKKEEEPEVNVDLEAERGEVNVTVTKTWKF
jgi:hypothetical protein